jgi:agmatine/peptidylarginine deiminase
MRPVCALLALGLLTASGGVVAQPSTALYPEGAAVPRFQTAAESAWLAQNPISPIELVTPPPTGPIHCAAEYEPMAAILIAWEGTSSWKSILATMGMHITTTGNADLHVVVDSTSEISSAQSSIAAAGANMSRVQFIVQPTNTIWIRDYGPRYIYQGSCRAIVDHTYNRPTRVQDNALNAYLSTYYGHAFYQHGLVHGGGNYHLSALGKARTTRLINNENPSLTEQQIHDIWQDYQNVDTIFYDPIPSFIDATSHIDMWMQVIGDWEVVISDWPADSGSAQDVICDNAALTMAAEGYTVHRVPARNVSGTHYTYTNVVMCNDLVLVPSYTNSSVLSYNTQALAAWQAAVPTRTVVQVPCQAIVTAAGVMHCIVMHVPAHLGGTDPTAYLLNLNGGETLVPGNLQQIKWISDDDVAVNDVDLLLSTDGGLSYPTVIATGIPDSGSYWWTVPSICSGQARIRVVARDAQGHTGFDDSDSSFLINGAACSAAAIPYGTGKPGQLGTPTLSSNAPVFGAPWSLDLSGAWPGATGVLLIGDGSDSWSFDGGTVLVAFTEYPIFPVSAAGTFSLGATVPNVPELAGISIFWQAWIPNDPGAAGMGWASSNGLETRIGF